MQSIQTQAGWLKQELLCGVGGKRKGRANRPGEPRSSRIRLTGTVRPTRFGEFSLKIQPQLVVKKSPPIMSTITEPDQYSPRRERLGLLMRNLIGINNTERLKLLYRGRQYRSIADYIPINGWLATGEAVTLYETARRLPAQSPVIVEIGSWQGKSSLVIARGLDGKSSPKFYCIDPFNADGDNASLNDYATRQKQLGRSLRESFENNLRRAGVLEKVTILQGYSYDFVGKIQEPIDFLFIDGNHEYEAVLNDFKQWAPKVKPGGFVAFHDVSFNNTDTGPQRVIREEVLDRPNEWMDHTHVQSLFLTRKAPAPGA